MIQQPMRPSDFPVNIPVDVALKFATGLAIEGRFGDQVMFTLTDDRRLYLPPIVGKKIEELGIEKGESVSICKREVRKGRSRPSIEWEVRRVGEEPEAPEEPETPLEADLRRSVEQVEREKRSEGGERVPNQAAKPNGTAAHQAPGVSPDVKQSTMAERPRTKLEDALRTVVAAVFSASEYAKQIGYQMPPFSSEDIRTMANTLMIQNGGPR